jgi:hypothetical protein
LKMWPGDLGRRRRFGNSQHLFKPQTFPRLVRFSVIRLGQNTVLPILESQNMAQGQFGIVYKVRLHVDCLDLGDPIRQVRRNEQLLSKHIYRSFVDYYLGSIQTLV